MPGAEFVTEGKPPLAPLRLRLLLAVVLWFLLCLSTLALVPRAESHWRYIGILAGAVLSSVLVFRLRVKTGVPEEPGVSTPPAMGDRVAALVAQTVEHADRSAVAWATIVVTAHSLVGIALSKVHRPTQASEIGSSVVIFAAAFLVLGCLSLPGAHAISNSVARSRRAISVARNHPSIGLLYSHVYQDESPAWQADLLGISMNAVGVVWLAVGITLVALGTLLAVI